MKNALLLCFILCLLLAPGISQAAVLPAADSDALRIVRIYYASRAQLQELADRLDIWAVQPEQGTLTAQISQAEFDRLRAAGMRVEIDTNLTTQTAQVENKLKTSAPAAGVPGYPCYRTVEETFTTLSSLATAYPTLAQRIDIGDSWQKQTSAGAAGYDLWVLRLTSSARPGPKPRLFLMGEIHAREMTTAETVLRLGEELLKSYGSDPEATWLLDFNEIYLLPLTNPDGRKKAETGLSWRKNIDSINTCTQPPNSYGVDLNRNSTFHWGEAGSSPDTCSDVYHGPAPASEPEVSALQAYLKTLYPDRRGPLDSDLAPLDTEGLLISLHSYGGMLLWPYGWSDTLRAPNDAQLGTLGRKLAFFNAYLPQQASALYAAAGGTDDWAYGELGLAAYTVEMGSQFFEPCANFENTIWPANRAMLLYAAKAARRPYQAPAGPEVLAPQLNPAAAPAGQALALTASASGTRSSGAAPLNILAARYSIDLPSWAGGALHPLSAVDGAFNSAAESVSAAISTCGLTAGRHTLFIEAEGQNNAWGVPTAAFFNVTAPVYQARGLPGQWVTYPLLLCNAGSTTEQYTLQVSSPWETSLPAGPFGPLAAGANQTVDIKVRIPPGALPGTNGLIQLSWIPQSQPAQRLNATLSASVDWATWLAEVQK